MLFIIRFLYLTAPCTFVKKERERAETVYSFSAGSYSTPIPFCKGMKNNHTNKIAPRESITPPGTRINFLLFVVSYSCAVLVRTIEGTRVLEHKVVG